VRAAVVQVGRRVPDVVQHGRDVVGERAAARGNGPRVTRVPRILVGLVLLGDGQRIGLVEDVRRADVVSDERVVLVRARRTMDEPGFGLSVKNWRPTPGPPLWQVCTASPGR
jgi:hypothetical protein